MKNLCKVFILIFFTIINCSNAQEFLYILNDDCIINLQTKAEQFFSNTDIDVIKDPHGIILRLKLTNPELEFENLSPATLTKIRYIQDFLAKNHNPAIIEVHSNEISNNSYKNLKKWEISTVIANKIESALLTPKGKVARTQIHSVGFGEFLPPKNTPNNGSNYPNRIDIIILCDVNGE